jgi:hypothetical protein
LIDSRATNHLTHDLERLNFHDRYLGKDQIQVANSAGLSISHIGHSRLAGPMHSLALKNILHVPDISKNLLSVNRIISDIVITMLLLNFVIIFSMLRTRPRRKSFFKVEAAGSFI